MREYWILASIGLLTIVSTLFSSFGKIIDRRKKWWKRIRFNGYIVLICGLGIIFLTIWQYTILKSSSKSEKDYITSEIRNGVDSIRFRLFNELSIAFSEQGIQLESISEAFKDIKDSINAINYNDSDKSPVIFLSNHAVTHEIKGDTLVFNMQLISSQASSEILFLNTFIELGYINGTKGYQDAWFEHSKNIRMPENIPYILNLYVLNAKDLAKVKIARIGLIGLCKSLNDNDEIPIEMVGKYELTNGEFAFLSVKETKEFFFKYNTIKKSF